MIPCIPDITVSRKEQTLSLGDVFWTKQNYLNTVVYILKKIVINFMVM